MATAIIVMGVYRFHDDEPVLKYFLISIGSSMLLILTLLLCGKKEKKNEKSDNIVSAQERVSPVPVVNEEEIIQPCQETVLECAAENTDMRPRRGTPPAQPILPSKEPLRKALSSLSNTSTDTKKDVNNPYDTVAKKPPVFEYSGNSDSGNSIYAKVKDVSKREESAYAVVDIEREKDYDFVNGEVIRRTPEASNYAEPPNFSIYDKPTASRVDIEVIEETENSGASGIYEFVTDSSKNNLEPLTVQTQTSNDLYDFCGPATPKSQTENSLKSNSSCDITDKTTSEDSVKYNSLDRRLNPPAEDFTKRGRSSSKDAVDKCEKEESRLSRYLKFTQSKKHKKPSEETIEIEIPSPYSSNKEISVCNPSDGEAPPAPSITKLKQLSAYRKEYQSSLSHSPESSIGGSSPNETNGNQAMFLYEENVTNLDSSNLPYGRHNTTRHRPRMSDGCIQSREIPTDPSLKTQNSLPDATTSTQVVCDTTLLNKDSLANHIHLVLEKTTETDNAALNSARGSLISEPDYAEIDTRSDTRPPPLGSVPLIVNDGTVETSKGYTEINFGTRPVDSLEEDSFEASSGYAVVDFGKKNEDRRIRDLYAPIDFGAKRSRSSEGDEMATGDEEGNSVDVKYEGPYDIIPEPTVSSDVIKQENIYDVFN